MISTYKALVHIAVGVRACNLDCSQVKRFKNDASTVMSSNVQEL